MASESLQAAPPAPASRPKHCYRLRFEKAGDLRLVSHIDLMHVFERLLRRAVVPFASTQGFHPKPCLVFAQALALGVAGRNEVADLELLEPAPAAELLAALNRHAPPGLKFLDVRPQPKKGSVQVRRVFYRLQLAAPPDLEDRCARLLEEPRIVAERLRPRRRLVDIRPYMDRLGVEDGALTMALWVTPNGAARPEEVARALGLGPALDAGAVFERTHLELLDEQPADQRWFPDIPRLDEAEAALEECWTGQSPADAPPPEPRRSMPAEPLISTPLSFDT